MLELAYVEAANKVDCTATSEATANTIITLPAIVLDGSTPIVLEYYVHAWGQTTTTAVSFLPIFDALNGGGAAAIGRIWDSRAWVSGAFIMGFTVQWRLIPASGSHVYSIRGHVSAASTFSVFGGAGGAGVEFPQYLRALKVQFA